MPGPSASGPTPFCQVRVLLSISGRGWSLHSSKVGLHRPSQWPLPVLAWGHLLSKLPADPQTFANPLCLCSCRASSWMPSLPSPSRPQKSPLITRSTRVLMQEVLFVCFLSFQDRSTRALSSRMCHPSRREMLNAKGKGDCCQWGWKR